MKIIIQSFGDIITNSSTETFCISNGSVSDLQLLIDTILKVYGINNSSIIVKEIVDYDSLSDLSSGQVETLAEIVYENSGIDSNTFLEYASLGKWNLLENMLSNVGSSLLEMAKIYNDTVQYGLIFTRYTTNGITIAEDSDLSTKILDYTSRFVGGVAVSANEWSEHISKAWRRAIYKLDTFGNTNINIHYIIKDIESVNKFLDIYKEFKYAVLYFVLLPLMPSGRSKEKYSEDAFEYLLQQDLDWGKIAFGAHFYNSLLNQNKIKCYLYPPESLSKNLLLDSTIKVTTSSFNLNPIKEIKYEYM